MPKPIMIDGAFRRMIPHPIHDKIYDLVVEAIGAGMTADSFRRQAAECWEIALDEKLKDDQRAWESA